MFPLASHVPKNLRSKYEVKDRFQQQKMRKWGIFNKFLLHYLQYINKNYTIANFFISEET